MTKNTTNTAQRKKPSSLRISNSPIQEQPIAAVNNHHVPTLLYAVPDPLQSRVKYSCIIKDIQYPTGIVLLPNYIVNYQTIQNIALPKLLNLSILHTPAQKSAQLMNKQVYSVYQLVVYDTTLTPQFTETPTNELIYQVWMYLLTVDVHTAVDNYLESNNVSVTKPIYTDNFISVFYEESVPILDMKEEHYQPKIVSTPLEASSDILHVVTTPTTHSCFIQLYDQPLVPLKWYDSSQHPTVRDVSLTATPLQHTWITVEILSSGKIHNSITRLLHPNTENTQVHMYPHTSVSIDEDTYPIYSYTYTDKHTHILYYLQFYTHSYSNRINRILIYPYLIDTTHYLLHNLPVIDITDQLITVLNKHAITTYQEKILGILDIAIYENYICVIAISDNEVYRSYVLDYHISIVNGEDIQFNLSIVSVIHLKVKQIKSFTPPYILYNTDNYTLAVMM